jgi:MtN3 and saliva related transmembrane protein
MNYLDISRYLTIVASVVITAGFYAQVWKIFATKSAKDFSLILLIALVINEFAWLNYGYALSEWPIILLGCLNVPALFVALYGFFKYGYSKQNTI